MANMAMSFPEIPAAAAVPAAVTAFDWLIAALAVLP
jgi:hypothetical protein